MILCTVVISAAWKLLLLLQNFGPVFPRYSLQVNYGKTGTEYSAVACAVTIAHYEITCVSYIACAVPACLRLKNVFVQLQDASWRGLELAVDRSFGGSAFIAGG